MTVSVNVYFPRLVGTHEAVQSALQSAGVMEDLRDADVHLHCTETTSFSSAAADELVRELTRRGADRIIVIGGPVRIVPFLQDAVHYQGSRLVVGRAALAQPMSKAAKLRLATANHDATTGPSAPTLRPTRDYFKTLVRASTSSQVPRLRKRIARLERFTPWLLTVSVAPGSFFLASIAAVARGEDIPTLLWLGTALALVALLCGWVCGHLRHDSAVKKAADLETDALTRAQRTLLEELPEDPLEWPDWTLNPSYPVLCVIAVQAAQATFPGMPRANLAGSGDATVAERIAHLMEAYKEPAPVSVGPIPESDAGVPNAPAQATTTELRARHQRLSEEYGAYLCDPLRVLKEPLLDDVTDPLTGEFVEAYSQLTELPDDVDPARYALALERAWKSWRAASTNARRSGWSTFAPGERKRLQTAQRLLALALDPSSTDAERRSSYERVQRLLEGLLELPADARRAVEAGLLPQLAPSSAPSATTEARTS